MRMTRSQWLGQFFRPKFGPGPQADGQKKKKAPKRKSMFRFYDALGQPHDVTAHTRSEARARIKEHWEDRGRLPVGFTILKIGEEP